MPVWTWKEILFVAEEERLDTEKIGLQYYMFGGIIRYMLETKFQIVQDLHSNLTKLIPTVRIEVLRSVSRFWY
jgi:hypothetical protein